MSSDSGAAYIFLVGLIAYRWSLEGLLNSDTRLMKVLNPYLCCVLKMFNERLADDLSAYKGSLYSYCSGCRRKRLRDDGQEDLDS